MCRNANNATANDDDAPAGEKLIICEVVKVFCTQYVCGSHKIRQQTSCQ